MIFSPRLPIFALLAFCGPATLAETKTAPIPRDTSYSVASAHQKISRDYPDAIPVRENRPDDVVEFRNLVYAILPETPYGKRELHLDLFRPKADNSHPGLIMIHGGGWRSGDRSMQVPMAQRLAGRGFVTVCVEYQLSLEAKYPAAVFNIKAAIRWMRANAKKYGIDPDRIAISGSSAGGQLAILVGLTNGVASKEGDQGHNDESSAVQAIVDMDGVVDFLAPRSLNPDRKADSADVAWLGGSFLEKPAVWKDASPIFWASEHAPPILFLNSGYPRFHAGQDELIGMMNDWGIPTEVHKFNVKVHPFWLFDPWMSQTVDIVDAFLRKTLK